MASEAVTLRVLNVPVRTPSSSWVKVPRVIAMRGFLSVVRRDRPGDVSGSETATAPPSPRAAAGAQRRTGEAGKFESAAAARRPALLPAGEIFPADRLAPAPAGSRA